LAGTKAGEGRFYDLLIPMADRLCSEYLHEISKAGLIGATQPHDRPLRCPLHEPYAKGPNMKAIPAVAVLALALGAALPAPSAMAKGCVKGAVVGGVAGHMAGHHTALGAAGGCAIGHHEASKHQREADQRQAKSGDYH
jgi:hypothetical protein